MESVQQRDEFLLNLDTLITADFKRRMANGELVTKFPYTTDPFERKLILSIIDSVMHVDWDGDAVRDGGGVSGLRRGRRVKRGWRVDWRPASDAKPARAYTNPLPNPPPTHPPISPSSSRPRRLTPPPPLPF